MNCGGPVEETKMNKWLLALCPKHSYRVISWHECYAVDIYSAVLKLEQQLGRQINSNLEWVDGVEFPAD